MIGKPHAQLYFVCITFFLVASSGFGIKGGPRVWPGSGPGNRRRAGSVTVVSKFRRALRPGRAEKQGQNRRMLLSLARRFRRRRFGALNALYTRLYSGLVPQQL